MGIYCTSYCNRGHDLRDGAPVAHECYVLPVAALQAEMEGDYDRAQALIAVSRKRVHRGRRESTVTRHEREEREARRKAVYVALWADPAYVKRTERADMLNRLVSRADTPELLEVALRRWKAAARRCRKMEQVALEAAGFKF